MSSASLSRYKDRVLAFYRKQKRMPSITEVMELCDFSSRSSAAYVVDQLVKEGVVEKDGTGKLLPAGKMHELPLVGHIRAGFAAPAEDEIADLISVGEYLIPHPNRSYLLQVEGDSMIDAGIQEGDMVIFERTKDAKPGDIVVALTENGYTLKYLRKRGGQLYLEAANEAYPEIHPIEGEIVGVVKATFRRY
ncbi:MAG: LexA family transcriptional regulator [Candidatus Pacebacteria bacterium]|nr:LexA family transcriptional regulator [Candidatus Paceibacterota bacterium]